MINSIRKALDIIGLFTPYEPVLTLAKISTRLGLPRGTTYNLLETLIACRFIERVDDDHFALDRSIIAVTQSVLVNVTLRDRAAPLLRQLADYGRESVYLTVRDGDFCLYTYGVESPRRLLARTAVGDRADLHCTAVGKAMLSCLPDSDVRAIAQRSGLPRFTIYTLTDIDALLADLEKTRARGYSIDNQEHELDTYCLGAPVLDQDGQLAGALSISGADPGLLLGRLNDIATHVMYTAQEASRRMGYVPPRPSNVTFAPVRMQEFEVTQ